ncbi:MAG: spore maturation protein [Prevotellaceae bacterium]|jgi:spore maturation protein SpmA|nr:spore maturation protein [Prevotellaceae bacterium]
MLNYIWIGFFLVAFVVAIVHAACGDAAVFGRMMDSLFAMARLAVMDIALPLTGIMALWLGFMNIGERAGAIRWLSRIVAPFFSRLFPEIPKDHPASGQIVMNLSANILGLDNAATPLGLKAMHSLQELNPNKQTASNAQILFLVLNTSSLMVIPVSIIAQRAILGAANPTDVFLPILIATYVSSLAGLIIVAVKQKINLFHPSVFGWIGGITAALSLLVWYFTTLTPQQMSAVSTLISSVVIIGLIVAFMTGAWVKKVSVFDAFVDGAKDGFSVMIKIIPYLVGMLVGIGVFRASGAMDYLTGGLAWIIASVGLDTDFVNALPTALMKPLSGSGARAMMVESMTTYGADSFVGRLSCVLQGAADTTFYIVALYFGAVGIKRTRYAIGAGLLADMAGVIAAIVVAYLFFT